MAKSRNKTTAIPAPVKRTPEARRYRSRAERNAAYNRLTLIAAGIIGGIIVLILAGALLVELVITPNQPVAVVGGQSISTHDFQRRVVFERWRQGSFLANMVNQFGQYGQQMLTGQGSPYANLYQQLSQPALMGQQVLDQMTNDLLIKQYADANNIKADDADIQKRVEEFFGYQGQPTTPTATITPSITPTPLVSPTPTTTPTITPAPSQTATPTLTPFPTGIPTVTPGATERKTNFDTQQKTYYEQVLKATGYTQDDMRQVFLIDALRTKVKDKVVGKAPDEQDEVKARHILVKTEEEANDAMKALQGGESFANLAKAISTDTGSGAKGGELGWAPKGQYVPEFEAAVWNDKAKVGDILGPIKSQFGYHIIQLEGREKRPLDDTQKTQWEDNHFNDWLKAQSTEKNVQKFNNWVDTVPTHPTITELGLPDLSTQGGSGLPGDSSGFPGGIPGQ